MSSSSLTRGALGALCAAAALALTACGPTGSHASGSHASAAPASAKPSPSPSPFADLSGADVLGKALTATRSVTSLRLNADVNDPKDGHIVFDMALSTKGDCTGTVKLGSGGALLTKVGSTVYLKFDEQLVREQADGDSEASKEAAVDLLADHWVKTSATSADAKDFASFCDLDALLAHFKTDGTAATKGPLTTVDGQKAIRLTESTKKGTIDVAAEGQPYILRIAPGPGDDATGNVTFSEFDKPVVVKAPTDRHILDLDKLSG